MSFLFRLTCCVPRNLAGTSLGGQLPLDDSVWSSMTQLDTLDLGNDNCTGYVPAYLVTDTNITTINLQGNTFTGQIPYRNRTTGANLVLPSQAPTPGDWDPPCLVCSCCCAACCNVWCGCI